MQTEIHSSARSQATMASAIPVTAAGTVARYEQLAGHLVGLIDSRVLNPGDRLPSVRQLSAQHAVSISTVVQALRVLEDRGRIQARPQSGFYVKARAPGLLPPRARNTLSSPSMVGVTEPLMQVLSANEKDGLLPFGAASPDPSLLPTEKLMKAFTNAARRATHLLAAGYMLRTHHAAYVHQLQRRAMYWGGELEPSDFIVTSSCTEALNLCLRAVTQPGDTVALESPTYFALLQILESLGLKALEIPTDPITGISVEALDMATRNGQVSACLLVPNGQNPLGYMMPDDNKRRLVQLMAERGVPVIEDDIYADLCQGEVRPKPLKAFDTTGNVMLCSSFAKVLSPMLRVGYVAAGRYASRVAILKHLGTGACDPIVQAAVAEFLESGGYDHQRRKLARAFQQQVERMSDAVARHFPAGCSMSQPLGGCVLWIELPAGIDTMQLHAQAVQEGIAFMPGALFSTSTAFNHCLRINCGNPWHERFEDGIRRLGERVARTLDA